MAESGIGDPRNLPGSPIQATAAERSFFALVPPTSTAENLIEWNRQRQWNFCP